MSDATDLLTQLSRAYPAVARTLSPLGRAAAFPRGIPFQAGEARAARLNATIGQVTDGAGAPMPLGPLAAAAGGLDPRATFLYSPQPGHAPVREGWRRWQALAAGGAADGVPATLPFMMHGLTHGLASVADLFVDADTTVILPDLAWENYDLVFSMRAGAPVLRWSLYDGDALGVAHLADALARVQGKAVVVLNFPSNPTGFTPTPDEVAALADALAAHPGPLVVVVDDAYQGVVHEPGRQVASLYWTLARRLDPERAVVVKVDGATKELFFFPSRVGFLTFAAPDADAAAALENKLNGLVRGTVGSPPGPSQAIIAAALGDLPATRAAFEEGVAAIRARYEALRDALASVNNPRMRPLPFNGAYFLVLALADGLDPEVLRLRLLKERSVGVIALGGAGLRLAYCSTRAADLPEIVHHIDEIVASA
jgi:aspartate/methionine/tyrosine aminotransferase